MTKWTKEQKEKFRATMAAKKAAKKAAKQAETSSEASEIPLSAIPHGMKRKGTRKMPPVNRKEEIALELAKLFNKILS